MDARLAVFCTFSAIIALSEGFLLRDQSNWNGLKATWGINPLTSFGNLPRTKSDAVRHGWHKYGTDTGCSSSHHFLGERYWKGNDLAIILIFDPAGYIAGIQAGIPTSTSPNPNNFPFGPLKGSPFVLENGINFITAYFVNPSNLCHGRTAGEFNAQGTGTGLWLQNGTNPVRDSVVIPKTVKEAEASMWTKGVCFATMGLHFWYDTSKDMNCDHFYPVFLLYNDGQLNGFGWAFAMDITSSRHYEHPPSNSYGTFMNPVPDCLYNLGTLTTLHIYLTDSALADTC